MASLKVVGQLHASTTSRLQSLVQGNVCNECDSRHNTGDVVSELICRQTIQHARFLSSITNRCDLCVRCSTKYINTVSETTSFVWWPIGVVERLLIGDCQSFHERNEKIVRNIERANGIHVDAVRADHRAISVDETCFRCLPFPVDFGSNSFCVRISAHYIHPGRWRIIVDESPVLFFFTHSPSFAFYSWRYRSMSVSYQGCGVVSRTRTLRHGACLSRQLVRQVLYTCTNSSACRSFVIYLCPYVRCSGVTLVLFA